MDVRVDRRVELFSILFRMAGARGYDAFATPYREAVESWFGPHADHPAIEACRQLRAQFGIGFNAPVGLAVFLDPKTLEPLHEVRSAKELDERWRNADVDAFLRLVRDFARSTDADAFFRSQRAYFKKVERAMSAALKSARVDEWFSRTLGRPARTTFHAVPGLLTGNLNYGASTPQKFYQVVYLENVDLEGVPRPTRKTAELVAHELAHAYVNPIVERHAELLVPAAQPLFEARQDQMQRQHYRSPKIMVCESLVRAIAAFFARERLGAVAARELVQNDEQLGFTWIRELTRWISRQPKLDLSRMVQPLSGFFAQQAAA